MSRDLIPINKRDPFWKDPFFSSSWEDFDVMRQDLLDQNKDFWKNLDKDFEDFDDKVKRQHSEMDRQMAPLMPQIPSWAVPDKLKDKYEPMVSSHRDEVIKVNETGEKFEVALDVSQYKPEELKVSTTNNILSIEGKREEQRDFANSSSSVTRQFARKWTLPDNCNVNLVTSNLSSDGVLMVTAPKREAVTYQLAGSGKTKYLE